MKGTIKERLLSRWPWLLAAIIFSFTASWWFALLFALVTVFAFGVYWPGILSGFIIDILYGPHEAQLFFQYRFTLLAVFLTVILLALRKRTLLE